MKPIPASAVCVNMSQRLKRLKVREQCAFTNARFLQQGTESQRTRMFAYAVEHKISRTGVWLEKVLSYISR
jgi:hypothetical protein